MTSVKFSDTFSDVLVNLGYTHCFFVAGGNIMHLIESLSQRMTMVPVVNEVATVIAAEYFNEVMRPSGKKALAMVTAGPGLTNALTGMAGAFTESREVLVVGGQVKKSDLSRGKLRQRGIQEIDGIALAQSISLRTLRIEEPIPAQQIVDFVYQQKVSRKGPLFIEICLDAQNAAPVNESFDIPLDEDKPPQAHEVERVRDLLEQAQRPVLLLGSGVDIQSIPSILSTTEQMGLPLLSTWNGADRIPCTASNFWGRPNNWGQRHSNLIMQQADLVIAAGTRLGFQQTGFNYQEFAPLAQVVHIDIDRAEIEKGHPRVDLGVVADAAKTLELVFASRPTNKTKLKQWLKLCDLIRARVPVPDPENSAKAEFVEIFGFVHELSTYFGSQDVVIPCSSGGGSTVTMQVLQQRGLPQRIVTNKGMASMGYGLPGAIGAAFARPDNTTWLIDGDGGLIQNTQEFGVVGQFELPIKTFIISNNGYASIRSTQRNYFGGHYVGCDPSTGLQIPDWEKLAEAYRVGYFRVNPDDPFSADFLASISDKRPVIYEIPVDPEQTFYPKIQSRISATRGMESNPLHEMTPHLNRDLMALVAPHLKIDPSLG